MLLTSKKGVQVGPTSFQPIKSFFFFILFNRGALYHTLQVKRRGFKAPHMTWRLVGSDVA
ncbi:hypothetical protein HanRHA438_Chr15g0706751 [Helianthus annuus]|nr:hypothetical protein HanRHA438_Chr15g0706751 [Helianthus annuus]